MSDRDDLTVGRHHGEHRTRRDTERITYDRLRSAGQSREQAQRNARQVADRVHRNVENR